MSGGSEALGAFFACLLLCPSEGLPLQRGEPVPTLQGTRYDCTETPRGETVWYGQFTGHHSMSDDSRTIRVEGCFPDRGTCERVLDRFDGLTFGRVYRSCDERTTRR
jgi:hypothetical protein